MNVLHHIAAIIGAADTAMGRALARSLRSAGFEVLDVGISGDIPAECNLVLYCHDAAVETARHATILELLCHKLAATRTPDSQVHVCVFTPAGACAASTHIREEAALHPHSLRELAYVQAEMALLAWNAVSSATIVPHIFRHGELYGEVDSLRPSSHVSACLEQARAGRGLLLPGLGAQKRTLTHIDDFADAVSALLKQDLWPSPINIHGERLAIIDYMNAIAEHFGVELAMSRDCRSEDLPRSFGDFVLSSALFNSEVAFKPRYRFKKWLATQLSHRASPTGIQPAS